MRVPSDGLGHHLAILAGELGASGLVLESRDGGVLGHLLLESAAPSVIQAILYGSSAPLHGAMTARASAPFGEGTPAVTGRLEGSSVVVLPITALGQPQGWLWVLADAAPDTGAFAQLPLRRLGRHLASLELLTYPAGDVSIMRATDPLPSCFTGMPLWLLAAEAEGRQGSLEAHELERALRRSEPRQHVTHLVAEAEEHAVLLGTPHESTGRDVQREVNSALVLAGSNLRVAAMPVRSTVAVALGAASRMLSVPFRGCVTPDDIRPALVRQQLSTALAEIDHLFTDPLTAILERDRLRGTSVAPALLSWLEADRDMFAAAATSGVHVNTLRYRVKRGLETLGAAPGNPIECCELYLRLLQHLGETARPVPVSSFALRSAPNSS